MQDRRTGVLWLTMGLVLTLLAGGIGYFAVGGGSGVREPRAEAGLWTGAVPVTPAFGDPKPVLAPDGEGGASATEAGVAKALAPLVADPRLGSRVAVSVVDVETGQSLYGNRETEGAVPASTTKIVTAAALLGSVGPYHRFATRVVAGGASGEVVLVGGGDPTLAVGPRGSYPGAARLDLLARQVKAAAGGKVTRVLYDSSLFTGPSAGPGWHPTDITAGYAAPVSALTVNGGRLRPAPAEDTPRVARAPRPDLFAAREFARLLGVPASAVAPGQAAGGARQLGLVESPPVQHLVEQMLQLSDNVLAESLLRQVAVARKRPATFAGGAEAVRAALQGLGLDAAGAQLVDGSGLSLNNRLTTSLLTAILRVATGPDHPALRGLLAGLPVAAYSGTLANRFGADRGAAGEVRAKTGTLEGVNALSGVVLADNGRQLAFAVLADGVPAAGGAAAQQVLDRIAARLAGCGCG